jgi:DeoR/GlpR family transcriptional regulator of sugar metabolism
MLQRAKKTVALLDHSKLENTSIASFRQANEIDLIITDKTADASVVEKYLKAGTNVKVCL